MKTLSIQLKDEVYEKVVNEAKRVDRSVRNMVSVLVEKGLDNNTPVEYAQPVYQPTWEMPPELEERVNRYEELKRKKKENPELQAIKEELENLSDELKYAEDSNKANEIMIKMQELQNKQKEVVEILESDD